MSYISFICINGPFIIIVDTRDATLAALAILVSRQLKKPISSILGEDVKVMDESDVSVYKVNKSISPYQDIIIYPPKALIKISFNQGTAECRTHFLGWMA